MNRDTGEPAASPEASARLLTAIAHKRAGLALEPPTIEALVHDYTAGRVPDYQMAAWLATVACRGLDTSETIALTRAYVAGGRTLSLGGGEHPVVDKHSTGGVGDKVTPVVAPLVAACGVAVAKVTGRGLGHAGGTLDKLESIRGLRLDLTAEEVRSRLRETGLVITGQGDDLVPGDRATYGLRDVTGTVDNIELIAASVLSKKLAVGPDALVLDVKTGLGAVLPERADAVRLVETMLGIAESCGLRTRAVLTDMDQPLGYAVGNALEIAEAVRALRGEQIPGLSELCRVLAALMLRTAHPELTAEQADERVERALLSGRAHERFLRWVEEQGGDPRQVDRLELLPRARHVEVVPAPATGWVDSVDPRAIGTAALRVGAGRLVRDALIDHGAGVVVHRRIGDEVAAGEPLAEIHHSTGDVAVARELIRHAFSISPDRRAARPVIDQVF